MRPLRIRNSRTIKLSDPPQITRKGVWENIESSGGYYFSCNVPNYFRFGKNRRVRLAMAICKSANVTLIIWKLNLKKCVCKSFACMHVFDKKLPEIFLHTNHFSMKQRGSKLERKNTRCIFVVSGNSNLS